MIDDIHRLCDQVHDVLGDYPNLITHLRENREPGRVGDSGRRAPGFSPQAPIALSAVDAADDLYKAICEHSACIADVLGTKPPLSDERAISTYADPGTLSHHTKAMCRFIDHQLPLVRDDELAREIARDLLKRYKRAASFIERDPNPVHVQAKCPNCRNLSLWRRPPETAGGDETYVCDQCGLWPTEQQVAAALIARQDELTSKPGRKRKIA